MTLNSNLKSNISIKLDHNGPIENIKKAVDSLIESLNKELAENNQLLEKTKTEKKQEEQLILATKKNSKAVLYYGHDNKQAIIKSKHIIKVKERDIINIEVHKERIHNKIVNIKEALKIILNQHL
jgi:hypothetical protein